MSDEQAVDAKDPKPGQVFPYQWRGDVTQWPTQVTVLHVDDRFVSYVDSDGHPGIETLDDFAIFAQPLARPSGRVFLTASPVPGERGRFLWDVWADQLGYADDSLQSFVEAAAPRGVGSFAWAVEAIVHDSVPARDPRRRR